jgi:hypothetical protein
MRIPADINGETSRRRNHVTIVRAGVLVCSMLGFLSLLLAQTPDFAGYQQQRFIGGQAGVVQGAQMIPGDFNGDGKTDMLVFRSSDGAFWKWYGDSGGRSADFSFYQQQRFIGGKAGVVTGAQMIPGDFNGDGKTDILVFRSSDGAFWKWYGDAGGPSADFSFYQQQRFIGGKAGVVQGAQMIPADFNGDKKTDILIFRSSDGAFWKWYGDTGGPSADFSSYQQQRFIGGKAGVVMGAQMIPGDFNGDGKTDILVFRSSDGAFWKWYGDTGGPSADFSFYQQQRFIGGQAGVVMGAQMIPADFNGDKKKDILVFRSSDGAFWKWYGDTGGPSADFSFYQQQRFIGGKSGVVTGAQMIPADFNGDKNTDMLVFHPPDGAFWKWYAP